MLSILTSLKLSDLGKDIYPILAEFSDHVEEDF